MESNLRAVSIQQATRTIIRLLPMISDENLIRLTRFGERLADDVEVLDGIRKVRQMLETAGHPEKGYA